MALHAEKAFVGLLCFVLSLIFGLLPSYLLTRRKAAGRGKFTSAEDGREESWLKHATSFGGGVFLGASLMHLLPEAAEVFSSCGRDGGVEAGAKGDDDDDDDDDDYFPLAGLLCALGFVLVLALEGMLNDFVAKTKHGGARYDRLPSSADDGEIEFSDMAVTDSNETNPSDFPGGHFDGSNDGGVGSKISPRAAVTVELTMPARDNEGAASGFALVGALSLHSVFDGLAVGSATSRTQLGAVAMAVLAHKPVTAFALGSMLLRRSLRNPWRIARLVSFFSISSPVGILMGTVLLSALSRSEEISGDAGGSNASYSSAEVAAAACQSIAAGTFLYAATVEALGKDSHDGHNGHDAKESWKRVAMCCLGIASMASLKTIDAD